MDSMLVIRPADTNDAATLLRFIKHMAAFERLQQEVSATEGDLRRSLFGEHPVATALIGEWDGQPVAYAIYFKNYSTFRAKPGIYLEDLFVLEAFRNRGIGRRMLAYLASLARDGGYGRLQWQALRWNEGAKRLYERLGAVEEKEWTGYRLTGEDLNKLADEYR